VAGEAGVGVIVGVGCPGVGEETAWPGIVSTWPTERELGSAMLLERTMSSTVTPNREAMPERVSPAFTLYVTGGTVAAASGVGVGDGTGVTTRLIVSPLLTVPPQAPSNNIAASNKSKHAKGVQERLISDKAR